MESLRSLSRLELGGWPSGTGRSSTSSSASQTGAERADRPAERRSQEREGNSPDAPRRRRGAEGATERAREQRREARGDRKQRFEERLEQPAERRKGATAGPELGRLRKAAAEGPEATAGSSKFGLQEFGPKPGKPGQKPAVASREGRWGQNSGLPPQVEILAGRKSIGQAPTASALPLLAAQTEGSDMAQGPLLVTPGLLPTQVAPMGALGFASGALPGEGLAPQGEGLAQELAAELPTERPGAPGLAEARTAQPGLPGVAQGAEAVGGDALSALDASGEPDADPRLEISRREAPVREAGSRASEVDSQRALRAIEQVRVQLRPGQRAAEIQLAPAELGRLAIRLKVERGNVHAVVRVEQPETLAALERFLPELRAALSAQGLDVGGMDLALAGDGASGFSESFDESAPRHATAAHDPDPTPALERHVNLPAIGVSDDAVDTFA